MLCWGKNSDMCSISVYTFSFYFKKSVTYLIYFKNYLLILFIYLILLKSCWKLPILYSNFENFKIGLNPSCFTRPGLNPSCFTRAGPNTSHSLLHSGFRSSASSFISFYFSYCAERFSLQNSYFSVVFGDHFLTIIF